MRGSQSQEATRPFAVVASPVRGGHTALVVTCPCRFARSSRPGRHVIPRRPSRPSHQVAAPLGRFLFRASFSSGGGGAPGRALARARDLVGGGATAWSGGVKATSSGRDPAMPGRAGRLATDQSESARTLGPRGRAAAAARAAALSSFAALGSILRRAPSGVQGCTSCTQCTRLCTGL